MNRKTEEAPSLPLTIPGNPKAKRAFWQEEVKRWRASGQSQRLYSRERGLIIGQLSYWAGQFKSPLPSSPPTPKKSFVPIKLEQVSESCSMRIKRADGLSIELSGFPDSAQLKLLLEVLTC